MNWNYAKAILSEFGCPHNLDAEEDMPLISLWLQNNTTIPRHTEVFAANLDRVEVR